jgi:uncharacterized protein YndB with AHSA1/START domain
MTNRETVFSKDIENQKLTVVRSFDAALEQVWKAWTKGEILDQWWAPKPYRAETKIMDFKEGGLWLYSMIGPKGDISWCKESFKTIDPHKSITNSVCFCDEAGNENPDFPVMYWKKEFSQTGSDTTVTVEITFAKETDLETIIKMGFQEGFTAGLSNLDAYLSTKG